jgi:enterochelin esterase family protein
MPPVIAALPNCFTRYGGSQYLNSTATGRYEDYLVEELVPFVDGQFRTLPEASHRGITGKSSGGYGALVLGMRHPDVFGGLASHSGDTLFEYCYRNYFPEFVNGLAAFDGKPEVFLAKFESMPPYERGKHWFDVLNALAMSACYSPNSDSPIGFDIPCDTYTGELIPEVWERWLAWDPVRMVDQHVEALRGMRCLYLECGTRDEFHLHLGARALARKLASHDISYQHEEFDGGHMNISYRYDVSLPILSKAISPA